MKTKFYGACSLCYGELGFIESKASSGLAAVFKWSAICHNCAIQSRWYTTKEQAAFQLARTYPDIDAKPPTRKAKK